MQIQFNLNIQLFVIIKFNTRNCDIKKKIYQISKQSPTNVNIYKPINAHQKLQ